MELKNIIEESLNTIDFKTLINNQVKESVEKSVKKAIESSFSYSGVGTKIIEKAFEEMSLPENLDMLDYRDFMIETCTESLKSYKSEEEKKRIQEYIKDRMGDTNTKEMTLDQLIQKLNNNYESKFEDDPCGCYSDKGLKIEVSRNDKHDWWEIKVNEEGDKVSSLTLSERDGKAFCHHTYDKYSACGADTLFRALAYHKTIITELVEEDFNHDHESYMDSKY